MKGYRHGALLVLAVSGVLGFRVGFVEFPTWQVAVETAQVVAGLVTYPDGNPFYVYHTKLWTMFHQAGALLLLSGVSEIMLSKLISGLLAAVSFQALSMVVYAFTPDALLAIGAPFFVFYTRAAEHGSVYPISLLGTEHTYGVAGLSLAVLIIGLLGSGCYRLGAFMLGVAPAVHASWSAWLYLIAGIAFLLDFRTLAKEVRPAIKYFVAGFAVTVASLLIQRFVIYDVPPIDPAISERYLKGFLKEWDHHRQPAPLVSVGLILNIDVLVMAIVWLAAFSRDAAPRTKFVVRAAAASAAVSLPLLFVSWISPDNVPGRLLVLMPSRFLNFDTFAFVALMLGLLGLQHRRVLGQLATLALVVGLFFSYRSMVWDDSAASGWFIEQIKFNPWHVFVASSIALLATSAIAGLRTARPAPAAMPLAAATARAVSLALVAASLVLTWRQFNPDPFLDRTNEPMFAAMAAETDGLLLTAGQFHLVQLRTRRPVLLDGGGLDGLPYAVEGAPQMERILGEVYNIDLFHPAPEVQHGGAIPYEVCRVAWEGHSRLKWLEIGHDFNVTQVIAPAAWTIDLPIAAEDPGLKLYRIPR